MKVDYGGNVMTWKDFVGVLCFVWLSFSGVAFFLSKSNHIKNWQVAHVALPQSDQQIGPPTAYQVTETELSVCLGAFPGQKFLGEFPFVSEKSNTQQVFALMQNGTVELQVHEGEFVLEAFVLEEGNPDLGRAEIRDSSSRPRTTLNKNIFLDRLTQALAVCRRK